MMTMMIAYDFLFVELEAQHAARSLERLLELFGVEVPHSDRLVTRSAHLSSTDTTYIIHA
jgi:hypothetical protein